MNNKTALISMPFGAVDRPALGISLLKASLIDKGLACDVHYLYKPFVEAIGLEDYEWLTNDVPYTCFAGDWLFSQSLYGGDRRVEDQQYIDRILRQTWQFSDVDIRRVLRARAQVEAYLDSCMRSVDWRQYRIVGFSSTFTQNMASLSLAKRLRASFPDIQIVFGGANWEGQMGLALHAKFSFVDYACSGEADISFPVLVRLINKRQSVAGAVNGVVYRNSQGCSEFSKPPAPVVDINALRPPDFSDYFNMIRGAAIFEQVSPSLLMETSRGCWWGAKHHCTFCGLNGNGMAFRAKDSDLALAELMSLVAKWQVSFVSMVDNIIDMSYFDSFVKKLAQRKLGVQLFYETKSNLKRHQVKLLSQAKINNIQPGIESLSDHVLTLMRKGTSALRNIQLLKWCQEYQISVDWNILYGFPGETAQDYVKSFRLLTLIPHLQPPSGSGSIRMDRFSPYFQDPEKHGLKNVSAMPVFKYLYPFDDKALDSIACYFDFDYVEQPQSNEQVAQLMRLVDQLNKRQHKGHLRAKDKGWEIVVSDSRLAYPAADYRLKFYDRAIYLLIDEVTSAKKVHRKLQKVFAGELFEFADIQAKLDEFAQLRIAAKDGDRYLALAVYDKFPENWQTNIKLMVNRRPEQQPINR